MKKNIYVMLCLMLGWNALQAQSTEEGLKAYDFDKFEHARTIFLAQTTKEPANALNYYYLGQTYNNLYKPDSAAWAYQTGMKVNPSHSACYAGMGGIRLNENKSDEAKALFDKALQFAKDKNGRYTDVNTLVWVAENMIGSEIKFSSEAENLMKTALELDRRNYNALITMGDVYLEINNAGEAANNYERAISLDQSRPKAYARVANIWLRVRNLESTESELNRALSIDANYAPALKLQAELFYAQRKFDKAKEAYKQYLKNSEESTANKMRFAQILFRAKEYSEALGKIEDLIKAEHSNIFLYRMHAYSCYEVGMPKNDSVLFKKGLTSIEYFLKNTDDKKQIASDYAYYGKLLARFKGKDSLAIVQFKKSLEMDSDETEVYQEIAKSYNKLRKFDEAANALEYVIANGSKVSLNDYLLLGKAYYFGKKYDKADSAFAKLNQLKPEYPDAYMWRGNIASNVDTLYKTTVAKDYFEKYIGLLTADSVKFNANKERYKKDLVSAYMYLGVYQIHKENHNGAKEIFRKILQLDPENIESKRILSQIK